MATEHQIVFGPFRFDPLQGQLWRGKREVVLQPRPMAVLHYLLAHPGQVVSKAELLAQVWAGTYVTTTALRICVRAIRKALGEDAAAPRYLETVGRTGYRWICPLTSTPPMLSGDFKEQNSHPQSTPDPRLFPSPIVGREEELRQLQAWLGQALGGQRQVVFIRGEPGIGKTTVVDAFLERVQARGKVRVGRGQCVEQYGEGEAYLPVLEALEQVCRAPDGQPVKQFLSQHAPTWLLQMPMLMEGNELTAVQQRTVGTTRERMLRELADALEGLTGEQGLLLVFEDLHASDRSTVELIAYLAQRRGRARLLIIGTYRPATAAVKRHPIREVMQELRTHRQCQELRLELLSEEDVEKYLAARLGVVPLQAPATHLRELAREIHRRTDGNPFFLVNIIEYLLQQGLLSESAGHWHLQRYLEAVGIPESLRQMIEKQIEGLGEAERRVLVTASVQGYEFDSALVAQALAADPAEVEERLAMLEHVYTFVRLVKEDEFPDHTVTLRYRFTHVLYQNALYNSLGPTRRAQLSGAVARALHGYYGDQSNAVAAELAHLYGVAREFARAADFYLLAARRAAEVFAHREAEVLARRGLEMLVLLPDTPERARQELPLQLRLGFALSITQGYAVWETGKTMARARELCQQLGESPQLFPALWGLCVYYLVTPDFHQAQQLSEQLLCIAEAAQDAHRLMGGHTTLGIASLLLGELAASRGHLEQVMALHDLREHRTYLALFGLDPGWFCRSQSARLLWLLGYPEQSQRRIEETLSLREGTTDPRSFAYALLFSAFSHQYRREVRQSQEQAERCVAYCREYGIAQEREWANVVRGWAIAEQGLVTDGIAQMRQSITTLRVMHSELVLTYHYALLAEALGKAGQVEEGLAAVAEGVEILQRTQERFYEAELYRLKGQLTLKQSEVRGPESGVSNTQHPTPSTQAEAEAEACFRKALEIARYQGTKSLELRAATSLARLWQQQGKQKEAHRMLAEIYNWFTEGFDTQDLQEARARLEDLSQQVRLGQ